MTPHEARIQVTTEREDNRVAVAYEGDAARIEVFSERGMGRASVEIPPELWPTALTLRLHLGGLESLRFHYEPYTVALSVTSAADHMIIETLSEETSNTPQEIAPDSPYWMAVTRTPRPDDALRALYFDVDAPAAFLAGDPRAFTFEWLDFYR